MVMMAISESSMEIFSKSLCMPVTLLINFALFQYLMTMYYKRRREIRGALLIACAFGGFIALIPFSYPDEVAVGHLNDISETCSVLTFLIQITMIGRDINKKVKIPTIKYLTIVSELLLLLGIFVVAQNLFEVTFPHIEVGAMSGLDNIFEDAGLWFIFCFRFLILSISRGVCYVLEHRKLEMLMYLLFVTHEYPFVLLEAHSEVSWESVQALWNRLTLAMCIGLTIRDKFRKNSSNLSKMNNTNASRGPEEMSIATSQRIFRTPAVAPFFRFSSVRSTIMPASVQVVSKQS